MVMVMAMTSEAAERRRAQRQENKLIGSSCGAVPKTKILTIPDMLSLYVFIRDGSQVVDVDHPQSVLTLADFRNSLAGSKHQIVDAAGNSKGASATKIWLESPDRLEADTLTFHAGAPRMTQCPLGRHALNIWRPHVRSELPNDWRYLAAHFVDHVAWLWDADAEAFFDWLAHIEQDPGSLPHFGWLHQSRTHGTGRNWIASVLTRLWVGNVAASIDLVGLLDGGFNDRLSRCMLAIVDEINEGGGANIYKTANRLRQLVTAEHREINPKYGRKRIEHNAARWLIFSNHTGALPLDEHDRRFWIVGYDGEPKDAGYYGKLYDLLCKPEFIASVGEFLRRRDISSFNPGQRPPMNDAKVAMVEFSQSVEDTLCKAIVANWPADVITASELNAEFSSVSQSGSLHSITKAPVRHAMDRAGIRKLTKVRINFTTENSYSVRNHSHWSKCDAAAIKDEIARVAACWKSEAMKRAG
jgi:hypothetical protein